MPHEDGLPGAFVAALILGAHELSRILVAKSNDVKLGVPYYVPSWQVKIHTFMCVRIHVWLSCLNLYLWSSSLATISFGKLARRLVFQKQFIFIDIHDC